MTPAGLFARAAEQTFTAGQLPFSQAMAGLRLTTFL
jgi:hypothetical protein